MKKKEKTDNSKWLVASKVIDIIIYIIIIGTLVFWNIYPDLFPNLSVEIILISILILFGTSWLHIIENITEVKKLFQKLDTTDVMQYGFLNTLLDEVKKRKHTIGELKIVDTSAEDFLHLFANEKIIVNDCTLLLRGFDENANDYDPRIIEQIDLSIRKWEALKQDGKIKKLTIIKYYSNQTSFFCIIDNEMILSGFLRGDPIRDDPNVMFVDITSRKGYNLIQQYIKEFDYLSNFTSCSKFNIGGTVFAYTNVNKQASKDKLKLELRNTKLVSAVGLACTEITNLSYDELY